jgi:hypothetical protein
MRRSTKEIPFSTISRRELLGTAAGCLAATVWGWQSVARSADAAAVKPFPHYDDLLATLQQRGHTWRVVGTAPDRAPIVAVRAGGTKRPAILISAGSHSTEHAGVVAAVELISQLETDHEVWIVPCRDPIGLSGYRHALSLSLGTKPELQTIEQVEPLLRRAGQVLYDQDQVLLTLIGETGFANQNIYRRFEKGATFLEPLRGRRIYFPSRGLETPASGPLERAYTLVVTPDGEVLHLNRFHDTAWAPSEVRCIRQLMAEIQPGLTFDLHEHAQAGHFWMSARRQKTQEDEIWELRMARESARAVAASGAELAPPDYSPGTFFERLDAGLYWLHPQQRGEGLNLADFASVQYGPSFTIETGMRAPLARRVQSHMVVVQSAVSIFADRYK